MPSVQIGCSVMSNSLQPHELHHARPPYPSPTLGAYPNSYPFSWWCHSTISSSVVPFSSYPPSVPASGSFQMSQLFASGGQSTGVSGSTISPSNEHPGLIFFRMEGSKLVHMMVIFFIIWILIHIFSTVFSFLLVINMQIWIYWKISITLKSSQWLL